MKTLFSIIACVAFSAGIAFADTTTYTTTILNEATGSSAVYRVNGFPVKQLTVGHISGTSFANYSGTFTAYACTTVNGPCAPLKDVQGVAITKTHDLTAAGAIYNIDDMTQYIKVTFTATSAAVKNKLSVLLTYAGRLVSPN